MSDASLLALTIAEARDALAQRRFADKLNADFVGGVRSGTGIKYVIAP